MPIIAESFALNAVSKGHTNTYAHSDPDARATNANTRVPYANTYTHTRRNERPWSIWMGSGRTGGGDAGGDGRRAAIELGQEAGQ